MSSSLPDNPPLQSLWFYDWSFVGKSALSGLALPLMLQVALMVWATLDREAATPPPATLMYLIPVAQLFFLISYLVEKIVFHRTYHRPWTLTTTILTLTFVVMHILIMTVTYLGFGLALWV